MFHPIPLSQGKAALLRGRDKTHAKEFTPQIDRCLDATLMRVKEVQHAVMRPLYVNSGWRPPSVNGVTANAAPHSKHTLGLAVDFHDTSGSLRAWCLTHLGLLQQIGIWLEDFNATPTWVHMQVVAPGSAKRIFPIGKVLTQHWNGTYDLRFDGRHNSYAP